MKCMAYTDGASRGNPGDSGIGIVVRNDAGEVVLTAYGFIGTATNNIAEYSALLALLKRIKATPCSQLVVHSDSELMVRQMNGEYKVRDENLKEYHRKVTALRDDLSFPFELRYVPREQNKEADTLANRGIDSRKRIRI